MTVKEVEFFINLKGCGYVMIVDGATATVKEPHDGGYVLCTVHPIDMRTLSKQVAMALLNDIEEQERQKDADKKHITEMKRVYWKVKTDQW